MFEIVKKPFMNVLAEDVRYNPQQGLLSNIGENMTRGIDKAVTRQHWSDQARRMNEALDRWHQDQAFARQRMTQSQPAAHGLFGPGIPTMSGG
jgi:hypothetical protein